MPDPVGNVFYRGKWEYCAEYETGDTVVRAGKFYMCLLDCAGHDPVDPFNRNFWKPYSGDDCIPDAPDEDLYVRTIGEWKKLTQAFYRGAFMDAPALIIAHPSDVAGAFAVVFESGTFWIWNGTGWVDTEKNASGVGIEEAPKDGKPYVRKDGDWAEQQGGGGGGGVGKHAELPDLLPEGITGDEANHISNSQLEFILDYVERRPVRPTNLSPVDLEQEVGEQPMFESTPYLHPFNLVMYGYQLNIKDVQGTLIYDSGNLDTTAVMHRIEAGILLPNTDYYWQVRYQSGNLQWSEWSEVTTFRTQVVFDATFLLRPGILLPSQGDVINSPFASIVTTPIEEVGGLVQAEGEFEVATSPDFTIIVDTGTGKNTWQGSVELTRGDPYFVRARHKATTGEVSPWSYTRTFAVRNFYREQRIGIVLVDEANWIFQRVDGNFNRVDIDSEYWMNNAIWAGLNASVGTMIDGQEMLILPSFWIYSGVVPQGLYAGKRFWMIDPVTPSIDERAKGWHRHDAFYSPIGGWQDSLKISAHRIRNVGNVAVSTGAGTAYSGSNANIRSYVNARNTDKDNPLKRGWHVTNYREIEAIKLLSLIEYGSLTPIYDQLVATGTPYRGIRIWNAEHLMVEGLYIDRALLMDNATYLNIPLISAGSNSQFKIEHLYGSADGAPSSFQFDDWLVPRNVSGTTNDGGPSRSLLWKTFSPANTITASIIKTSGPIGLSFLSTDCNALMSKWD